MNTHRRQYSHRIRRIGLIGLIFAALTSNAQNADKILDQAGISGGLVVVLGVDAPELLMDLRKSDAFVVQGLDPDERNVEAARKAILAKGRYGPVSVDRLRGDRLPYAENMVNVLLVSSVECRVSSEDIERVLVPGGVSLFINQQSSISNPFTKPVPDGLGEWHHWLNTAGQNAVARDTVVGPPRRMQWVAKPLHSRGHEVPSSVGAAVTANGRLFYVLDEGQTGMYDLPSRWTLIARDAFNGVLLWKVPVPEWGPAIGRGGFTSQFNARRLATDGDRLFLPTGKQGQLTVLSAADGAEVKTWEDLKHADDILVEDGLLVAAVTSAGGERTLLAMDVGSWNERWRVTPSNYVDSTLSMNGGRVFHQSATDFIACDAADGKELWKVALGDMAKVPNRRRKKNKSGYAAVDIAAANGHLILSGNKQTLSLDPATGEKRWQIDGGNRDLFVIGDRLWRGLTPIDLATGEAQTLPFNVKSIMSRGHHPRCYPLKATSKYIINNNRGAEFVGVDGKEGVANDWLRGNCAHGVLPANGLLYAPPNQCFCYGGVLLHGFKALSSAQVAAPSLPPDSPERLEKGPAYGRFQVSGFKFQVSDWPMYRGGPERLGSSSTPVGAEVKPLWKADVGGRLTPPVAAGGLVITACKDDYTVYALDTETGQTRWQFTAGGSIDSPPTVVSLQGGTASPRSADGRNAVPLISVLFGASDGWVYCLDAGSGALVWRFLAAPEERLIGAFGRVESAWPASGSVTMWKGTAYVSAGRTTWLDGGIHAYGLDPLTGDVRCHAQLTGPVTKQPLPNASDRNPYVPAFHIEGTRNDLFVTDGEYLYLGMLKFDEKLNFQEVPYLDPDQPVEMLDPVGKPYVDGDTFARPPPKNKTIYGDTAPKGGTMGEKNMGRPRVFSRDGFLDDSMFNRNYWMYAGIWPGFYKANFGAKAGQILAVDDKNTYSMRAYYRGYGHSPTFVSGGQGYLLFADRNENEPVLDDRVKSRDKGFGYGRKEGPRWHQWIPIRAVGLVAAADLLFAAGTPDEVPEDDPYAAIEGRKGGLLWSFDKETGEKRGELKLASPPIFDGLIAADGRLYMSAVSGELVCLGNAP